MDSIAGPPAARRRTDRVSVVGHRAPRAPHRPIRAPDPAVSRRAACLLEPPDLRRFRASKQRSHAAPSSIATGIGRCHDPRRRARRGAAPPHPGLRADAGDDHADRRRGGRAAQVAAVYSDGSTVWDDLARASPAETGQRTAGTATTAGSSSARDLAWLRRWRGCATYPHQATREQQIAVAERLRDARGYQPWPACRVKLGLP